MSEWQAIIPLAPMATPRPQFRVIQSAGKKKVVTYYPTKYLNYMTAVQSYLKEQEFYNDNFYQTVQAPLGILMEVIFYVKVPKNQKVIKNLMHKTAPDIDNLEKAIMDSIFQGLKIRDSRIVGINSLKMNEKKYPRTEVKLIGIENNER